MVLQPNRSSIYIFFFFGMGVSLPTAFGAAISFHEGSASPSLFSGNYDLRREIEEEGGSSQLM